MTPIDVEPAYQNLKSTQQLYNTMVSKHAHIGLLPFCLVDPFIWTRRKSCARSSMHCSRLCELSSILHEVQAMLLLPRTTSKVTHKVSWLPFIRMPINRGWRDKGVKVSLMDKAHLL
eukprot:3976972-Amphidinium_carterae.1